MAVHRLVDSTLPQPSALRPQGWEVEVEVISQDLTEEQQALVIQVKQLSAVVHMAGFERAKRLRLLRDSFPVGSSSSPNQAARMGWADFLRREFDTNVSDVNLEIAAIEAADDFLDSSTAGRPAMGIFDQIGSSHLNEIGRGATPAIRRKVWDKLLDGKLNLNKRAIRAEVKQLNGKKGTKLEAVKAPPAKATAPAKLPTPRTGKTKVLSKAKYGYLDDQKTQLNYFKGKAAANAKLEEELPALIRACSQRGAGKATVLKALAGALHRELKNVSDRFYGRWNHDSGYPAYMTLWQSIWAEEADYKLGDDLESVRFDMAQSSKFYELTVEHVFTTDVEVLE